MMNPYQTPISNADEPIRNVPRPPSVTRASWFLWGSMIVGLLSLIPGVRKGAWEFEGASPIPTLILVVIITTVFVALILLIQKRRNWARWAILVFSAIGWLVMAADLSSLLDPDLVALLIDLACSVAELYACYLLFFGEGRQWFAAKAT